MKVEKVNETDVDLKEALAVKDATISELMEEKNNMQERINALEEALNERDLAIYNLGLKIAKL